MTSIKVKFRNSSVRGKKGTVYFLICHDSRCAVLSSKIHVMPGEWDEACGRVRTNVPGCKTADVYNSRIDNDLWVLRHIADEMEMEERHFTATDVKERFAASCSRFMVMQYMRKLIEEMVRKKRLGTAENYRCAMRSMTAFIGTGDMSFSALNSELIGRYSEWLEERGVCRNSISFYMRIWRAVFNRAVRENIVMQCNPFRNVYTGVCCTKKRAVDEDSIVKLARLDLRDNPPLELSRDLFMFSYCTRGMAFVDIAFLKKRNVCNGTLAYYRRKTRQAMYIHIEPCIGYLINKYRRATEGSDYLFPVLTEADENMAYRQYLSELNYHNRKLKRLAIMAGLGVRITSYTSRHSWATSARNHNIPLSVISAGMGHTSERTTEIYLASLENSVIDDANRNVISEINMFTRC